MGYHYLALVEVSPSTGASQVTEVQADLLRVRGLRPCLTAGPLRLYVSSETPTFSVPGGMVDCPGN